MAKSISDLVEVVDRRLKHDRIASPGTAALTTLFEAVFFTSLKTEEGKQLQVRVALVDPANPDPERPPEPRAYWWNITKLSVAIPLTVPNLVKLSKAADPWSSCLAAYYDSSGEFFIWGLIDQAVHFSAQLVHERSFGYAPPGLFQVVVTGTADLSVFRKHEFIARLAQDVLSRRQSNVFWSGPIGDRLDVGISPYIISVLRELGKRRQDLYVRKRAAEYWKSGEWDSEIADTWISTLCRLLISIQRYRHGGALLITKSNADLDIKYQISYPRLGKALTQLWVSRLRASIADSELNKFVDDADEDWIPIGTYLDNVIAESDEEDFRDEITGCVRFISSLSCVDGLVLAGADLSIRGFGVEIRTKKKVDAVYLVPGPSLLNKSLKKVDPNHYGTRHRSMMRYCFAHPDSIGFVISQDGEIRAMMRVKSRLLMWENLKVLDFDESRRRTLSKAAVEEKSEKKKSK